MNFNFKKEPGKKLLNEYKYEKKEAQISVIMPFYNSKDYIIQTINSVLNQTYPYFELLIIDDGSTDKNSLELLKEIEKIDDRIKIFHKKNGGLASARDFGVQKSSENAKYIFILDDDDLIDKTYFETSYLTLETNKKAAWAYADSVGFEAMEYVWNKNFDSEQMKKENLLVSCAMIRKNALLDVGGYVLREKAVHEDWYFWLKMIEKGYFPVHMSYYAFWYRRKKSSGELKRAKENRKRALEIIHEQAKRITKRVNPINYPRENYNWNLMHEKFGNIVIPKRKENGKTNILMIIPWMVMGGADKFNLDFLRLIDKEKYSVTLISTQPTEYLWRQKFEEEVLEVFDITTFLDEEYWPAFINYIIETRNINLFLNTNSVFGYAIIPYLKARYPNLPIIDYIHMEEWYNRSGGYSRDSASVSTFIDKTLFCNKSSEKIYNTHFEVPNSQTDTVYIGVDTDKFDPSKYDKLELRERYHLPKDKTIVGYICRLAHQKRPFLFIEIIKKYVKNNNATVFIIVGDGPLEQDLKDLVRRYNLNDYVIFLGKSDKPEEIYAMCDITLNCSIKEGLALTTYESLSMGVPVISSDVGGQGELVNDKVGKLLPLLQKETEIVNFEYEEEEIDLYVDAINVVKNNLDKLSFNARKEILKGFTLNNMIKNMQDEIDNIIKNPRKEACVNGKNLSKNMKFAKEYVNYFLTANKYTYSYQCMDYKTKYYFVDDRPLYRIKLDRIIYRLEIIFDKFHLYNEFIIFRQFVKSILKVFLSIFRLIKLEAKRVLNLFRKIFK